MKLLIYIVLFANINLILTTQNQPQSKRSLKFAPLSIKDPKEVYQVSPSIKYQVQQDIANITFLVYSDIFQYISVQVNFKTFPNFQEVDYRSPILCTNKDEPAQFIRDDNGNIVAITSEIIDLNGYYQQKNYLFNAIKPQSDQQPWFISILVDPYYTFTYKYQILLSLSLEPPCENDCMNPAGYCEDGICICSSNFLDFDCSQFAQEIVYVDQEYNYTLDIVNDNGFQYFYYEISANQNKELTLNIKKLLAYELDFYFLFNNKNKKTGLPCFKNYDRQLTLESSNLLSSQTFNSDFVKNDNKQRFIIGVYPKIDKREIDIEGNNIIFEINMKDVSKKDEEDFVRAMTIVAIASTISLLITCLATCCVCKKTERNNNLINEPLMQNNNRNNQLNEERRQQKLVKYMQFVSIIMPQKTLSELFKNINGKSLVNKENISCAVCLCDIEQTEPCRKTICNHVFHKDCIDPWLKQHENCPMCRKNISLEDMEQHQKKLEEDRINKIFNNNNNQELEMQDLTNQSKININNYDALKLNPHLNPTVIVDEKKYYSNANTIYCINNNTSQHNSNQSQQSKAQNNQQQIQIKEENNEQDEEEEKKNQNNHNISQISDGNKSVIEDMVVNNGVILGKKPSNQDMNSSLQDLKSDRSNKQQFEEIKFQYNPVYQNDNSELLQQQEQQEQHKQSIQNKQRKMKKIINNNENFKLQDNINNFNLSD